MPGRRGEGHLEFFMDSLSHFNSRSLGDQESDASQDVKATEAKALPIHSWKGTYAALRSRQMKNGSFGSCSIQACPLIATADSVGRIETLQSCRQLHNPENQRSSKHAEGREAYCKLGDMHKSIVFRSNIHEYTKLGYASLQNNKTVSGLYSYCNKLR